MKRLFLIPGLIVGAASIAGAVPAGPPAGIPILNSSLYQRGAVMNIDTATVRAVNLSTFTNIPNLPLGITINGATYNSSGFSAATVQAFYNVQDYGAKGNGANDDTAAIQTAINTSGRSKIVFFPPGTYRITSSIVVSTDGVTLLGSGSGTVITSTAVLHQNSASVVIEGDNVSVRLIKFQYVDVYMDVHHSGGRISAYPKIEDCWFFKSLHGIYLTGTLHGVQSGRVQNNYFEDVQYPIYLEGGDNNVISGNTSIDTLYDPALIDGSGGADGVHINVSNHIYVGGGTANRIDSNYTIGGVTGIILIPNTSIAKNPFISNIIKGNHVLGARGEGITLDCRGNDTSGSILATEASTGVNGNLLTVGSTVQAYQVYAHFPWNRKAKGKYFYISGNTGGGSPFTVKGMSDYDTAGQDLAISTGDKVQILVPALYTIIDGNYVEREATDRNTYGTDSGIQLWGLGAYTRIVNNVVKGVGTTQASLSGIGSAVGLVADQVGAVHHNTWSNNVVEGNMTFISVAYNGAPRYYAYGTQIIDNKTTETMDLEFLDGTSFRGNDYRVLIASPTTAADMNQDTYVDARAGITAIRGIAVVNRSTPTIIKTIRPEKREFAYAIKVTVTAGRSDTPAYVNMTTDNYFSFRRVNGIPSRLDASTVTTSIVSSISGSTSSVVSSIVSVSTTIADISGITISTSVAGSTTNGAYDATCDIVVNVGATGSYSGTYAVYYAIEIRPLYDEGNIFYKY